MATGKFHGGVTSVSAAGREAAPSTCRARGRARRSSGRSRWPRMTSGSAWSSVLPASDAMTSSSSARRASSTSPARCRIAARSSAPSARHPAAAAAALGRALRRRPRHPSARRVGRSRPRACESATRGQDAAAPRAVRGDGRVGVGGVAEAGAGVRRGGGRAVLHAVRAGNGAVEPRAARRGSGRVSRREQRRVRVELEQRRHEVVAATRPLRGGG